MNPIKSIKLKYKGNLNLNFDEYFEIERGNDYDYINTFRIKIGRICGNDNNGNYLIFPQEKDCPINDIFFSDFDIDRPGYKKIKFRNNSYLYYTNQNTEGKILIDLWDRYSPNKWKDAENAFSISFIEYLDYLNSVYYIGINLSSIDPENAYNRIKNFESIISTYKSLPIVMMVIFFILFSLHGLFASDLDSLKKNYFLLFYISY